ncbi:MAG: SGNH/GDSL hydrolase N-terminal domain-containing protein, partial [Planctomycetota bacterium]|nr:SGNH/GDSL hydrolase N-terminal domain-containing protein [Planctomycetota bacterium]
MLPVIALGLSTLLPASLSALRGPTPQESAPQDSAPPEGPVWRSIEEATVEGRAWSELAAPFDRLPARAEGVVRPPVWMLQRASAGVCARFVTNAKEIRVRWTLTSEQLAMPHMPATG